MILSNRYFLMERVHMQVHVLPYYIVALPDNKNELKYLRFLFVLKLKTKVILKFL